MSVTIDGFEIGSGTAYRAGCATPATCTVRVGGPTGSSLEFDAWFAAAMANDPAARRSFSLVVFNNTGTPVRRFFVANGIPTEMTHQNDRFQIVLAADGSSAWRPERPPRPMPGHCDSLSFIVACRRRSGCDRSSTIASRELRE